MSVFEGSNDHLYGQPSWIKTNIKKSTKFTDYVEHLFPSNSEYLQGTWYKTLIYVETFLTLEWNARTTN